MYSYKEHFLLLKLYNLIFDSTYFCHVTSICPIRTPPAYEVTYQRKWPSSYECSSRMIEGKFLQVL